MLHGHLAHRVEMINEINSLDNKIESRWNVELDRRFGQFREEQTALLNQTNLQLEVLQGQVDEKSLQVDGLQKHLDERSLQLDNIQEHLGERFLQLDNIQAHLGERSLQIDNLQKCLNENTSRSDVRLDFIQDLLRQHILLSVASIENFEKSLKQELVEGLLNEFVDNFDQYSEANIESIYQEIKQGIDHYKRNFDARVDQFVEELPMSALGEFHSQLSDNESKQLLVKLIAYRLLGLTKVRLRSAVDTDSDRQFYENLESLVSVESPEYRSGSYVVKCYDLHGIGLNFNCYTTPFAINTEFRNLQYASNLVHVRGGDWILDCGACWGDTSLWFADQIGSSGKVFSFEFIPSNLEIYHANLEMNPELSKCIELIQQPVGEFSGKVISCADNGAASTFKIDLEEDLNGPIIEAETVSIDDWVENRNPEKVDFIKMDIEGAELDALYGAQETLKRFRPRLGIALYHHPEDIYQIPKFIKSLDLGYQFYLKHPTAAGFETVLLAICD